MAIWRHLQTRPAWLRWPMKWLLFGAVLFAVLYPYPHLFVRQIQHLRQLNALPDPDEPALIPMRDRFRAFLIANQIPHTDAPRMLQAVNAFVCREIPYAWDWVVWGVADYVPTLPEVLASGREDCDGRAVVAAALLRAEGIRADLVADTRHMWVSTPQGETMNPLGPAIVRSQGGRLRVDWAKLLDLGPPAFGVSVFPLHRELVILATAWLLLLPRDPRPRVAAIALLMLLQALAVMRLAGVDPRHPNFSGIHFALLSVAASVLLLTWRGGKTPAGQPAEIMPTGLYVVEEAT